MTVHTVVLNHESTADTLGCLDALRQSTCRDQFVIVVDNGSSAEQRDDLVRALPTTRVVVNQENLGYAAGNNVAIRQALDAGADFVWVVNPDTTVRPSTLQGLLDVIRERPDVGAVGPRVLQPDGRIASDGGRVTATGRVVHDHAGADAGDVASGLREVDFVTGSCLLVRCATLEDVGLLPEEYFLYFEETDFALRAARAGWASLVVTSATVEHARRSATRLPSPSYLYYFTRGHMLFQQRWFAADVQHAVAELDEFVSGWRQRFTERAPGRLEDFEHVVARGIEDGAAGVTGASDVPGQVAWP